MRKKGKNKAIMPDDKKVQNKGREKLEKFFFPEYNIVIEASDRMEALNKLKEKNINE